MILTGVIAGILTTLALRFIDRKFTEMDAETQALITPTLNSRQSESTTAALAPFFTIAGV